MFTNTSCVCHLREQLLQNKISCTELLNSYYERIDKTQHLNAVVEPLHNHAFAEAHKRDTLGFRNRESLHGLPITVKLPFSLKADIVKALEECGAIVLGKTNVPEEVTGQETANPVYGVTTNPWDRSRTPGGSSGGEAGAVHQHLCAFGFGSDAGGSILLPCHYTGIYGHRCTHGLLPVRGHLPSAPLSNLANFQKGFLSIGPMARCPYDLKTVMIALTRYFEIDINDEVDLKNYKLAYNFEQPDLTDVDTSVLKIMNRFIHILSDHEKLQVTKAFPDLDVLETHKLAMNLWKRVITNDDVTTVGNSQQVQHVSKIWSQFFDEYDALICPIAGNIAPKLANTLHVNDLKQREQWTINLNGKQVPYLTQIAWTTFVNMNGLPCTAVPVGYVAVSNDSILPVGIQIVSKRNNDLLTIQIACLFHDILRAHGPIFES